MRFVQIILFIFISGISFSQDPANWTILYYAAGSNSSETDLLSDIAEMKKGKKSKDYNLILLIDRVKGFSEDSTTLDGNFTDTRLYQIENHSTRRLAGKEFFPQIGLNHSFEANMADAVTLQKFIQYGKKYFPADHYLLVLRSHGNGVSMCPDAEHGEKDHLYPAEITNTLTKNESVDILGLDVCSMAGLENLYQWRPENSSFSAQLVIASSPVSGAWAYDRILERITVNPETHTKLDSNYFEGGNETTLDPTKMTPFDFSKLILEEIYDQQAWCSWGLFDNTKISRVKQLIDEASAFLIHEQKEMIMQIIRNTLGYHHQTSNNLEVAQLTFPYLDAHHFWRQISTNDAFTVPVRNKAKQICKALDDLVLYSYYGQGFLPETSDFVPGQSGIYQVIPEGDRMYSRTNQSFWSHCSWFHPEDQSSLPNSYGQYDWCSAGAIEANNKVENFFELLDFLFDENEDVNEYKW